MRAVMELAHEDPGMLSKSRRRDLEADLARMRAVAQFCQQESNRVKDPSFKAIVGLMHDYIGTCQDSMARGGGIDASVDPITAPAAMFRASNVEQRLQSIFGVWFEIRVRLAAPIDK